MFYRGKPKLLTTLAALVGMCLSGSGCQVSLDTIAPRATAPTATYTQVLEQPATYPKPTPAAALPGGVQKAEYLGEGSKGQPNGGPGQASGGVGPMAGLTTPACPGCIPGGPGFPGGPGGPTGEGPGPIPREINKVSLPPYVVAPPDILYIDSPKLVPRPPYRIEPLETLFIVVADTLPNQPINGAFIVTPEGTINLGFGYGTVRVQGLTVEQIQNGIRLHLSNVLRNPQVSVSLVQFRGQQQIRGEHLVRPDGTINLGAYGCVYVAGMTLGQIRCVIEKHLDQYVVNPSVSVDVYAYNSQWYYVIFDGGGYGQQVYRLPITGNETVLDAISNLQGLPPQASQRRIWVARPAPCGHWCDQLLMVDWAAVASGGSTCTNYQLFPGDRVYVDSDCFVKADLFLAKVLAPVERILGVTLLGASVVNTFRNNGNSNTGFLVTAP